MWTSFKREEDATFQKDTLSDSKIICDTSSVFEPNLLKSNLYEFGLPETSNKLISTSVKFGHSKTGLISKNFLSHRLRLEALENRLEVYSDLQDIEENSKATQPHIVGDSSASSDLNAIESEHLGSPTLQKKGTMNLIEGE